jgi:DNA-directed RNA polymerase subunit RPC12/RpoP
MPYVYQKNAEDLFVCNICQITKKNQNTMHYHMKKHEGHLPYTCGTCKKEFLHAQTLALHISARHSNKETSHLICPCCPYNTLTKANRLIHFIRIHCEEEVKQFSKNGLTCSTCQKVCNSNTAYLYHIAHGCMSLSGNKHEYLEQII